jgi:hypothetical protein
MQASKCRRSKLLVKNRRWEWEPVLNLESFRWQRTYHGHCYRLSLRTPYISSSTGCAVQQFSLLFVPQLISGTLAVRRSLPLLFLCFRRRPLHLVQLTLVH